MAKFITINLARIESNVRINIDNIIAYAPRSQGAGVMTTIADGDSEYITRDLPTISENCLSITISARNTWYWKSPKAP